MTRVRSAFDNTTSTDQKIFVIYGLGGSGKTELALKYAHDYQQNFWGVFFVDGSSHKNAAGSYSEIAKIGGVEPNEKAAKNWLTTRALPWLLIIDNADDEEVQLDDLIPAGTKGSILVTSRNPAHKSYGTVGERYLELLPMDTREANELILKAAEEPSPWTKSLEESAGTICTALGFLPLALVHAGKAILLGLCSWHGYLTFYERQVERIRRDRHRSRSRSQRRSKEDSKMMNVLATYEILFQSLEAQATHEETYQDAIELLNVFSYFHFQNIRLDVLIASAMNPLREDQERKREAAEGAALQQTLTARGKPWARWLREHAIRIMGYFDTPPPLATALRKPDGISEKTFEAEVHIRLSEALQVLLSRSLIVKQDRLQDRYSIHPLVHKWVRDRPEMSTSQQALWCQVAATTISRSIFLPPYGNNEDERSMRRDLLPHIIHVRGQQALVRDKLQENGHNRKRLWPPISSPTYGRSEANEGARFSRVYSECGLFNEALDLQTEVHAFVTRLLGDEHELSIKISLVLTETLWQLSRVKEATQLQRRMYRICVEAFGQNHPLSLRVTDLLGMTLCFQGRWSEALTLHTKTVEGMTRVYGPEHENTLKAINNLARVHLRYMDYAKAAELHETAWKGLTKRLGESHADTLICLEDLAMARMRLDSSAENLTASNAMLCTVLERRRALLGREQPYTLLAVCNLGRVQVAQGRHEEAARAMRGAVATAERNLGENHYGVLAGKTHYARALAGCAGGVEEAEHILRAVVDKPQYRRSSGEDGEHPDRIIALWYLVDCLERQCKWREALDICESLVVALQEIGGQGLGPKHKFAGMLREEMDKLRAKMDGTYKDTVDMPATQTKEL
jgi:tetratricopeptide (TPR) repeat protein